MLLNWFFVLIIYKSYLFLEINKNSLNREKINKTLVYKKKLTEILNGNKIMKQSTLFTNKFKWLE